ncbi:hypothetical protein Emed_004369 [Eimeria media]
MQQARSNSSCTSSCSSSCSNSTKALRILQDPASSTGSRSVEGAPQTLLRLNDKLLLLLLQWLSLEEQHKLLLVCRGVYRQLCCLPFIRSLRCLSGHTGFELLMRQHRHHPLLQQQQQLLQQQQQQQQQLKRYLQQQREQERQHKRALQEQHQQTQEDDSKKAKLSPCAAAAAAACEPPSAVLQQQPSSDASTREPAEPQLPPHYQQQQQQHQQQQQQKEQQHQAEEEELQRYILACPLLSRLRRCEVVELAVPAHLPPSPLLLLMLLCCAKSLRRLQVTGYDYGSFRYHRRRQQQQLLLQRQQQQHQQEGQGEATAASVEETTGLSSSSANSSSTSNTSSTNNSSNSSSNSSDDGAWCSAASCLSSDWVQPGRLWFSAAAAETLLLRCSSKLQHLLLDVSLRRGFGVSPFAQLNLACKLQSLKELELVNLTRENFRCGSCCFPALETLRLHWIDVCPQRHNLGLLLQGCPSLSSLCVHADCDDDEVLVQTTGLFAAALQQLLQQLLQQPQHHEQQQQQQQTSRPPRVGVVEDAAAATAKAVLERGVSPLPLLQQLQLPQLASSTVPLLRAAAPQLKVLRLVHAESHRSGRGLLVLQQAAQQLQQLQQIVFPTPVDFVPNGVLSREGPAAAGGGGGGAAAADLLGNLVEGAAPASVAATNAAGVAMRLVATVRAARAAAAVAARAAAAAATGTGKETSCNQEQLFMLRDVP